jgi:alginate O-acetyltransferase complex protein AlgI
LSTKPTPFSHWIIQLGISFFTFEFIHFAVDRYTGKIKDASMSDMVSFIFFFPTMVAGPIKRFQEFTPKLRAARFDPDLFSRGITRILIGIMKKHVFADTLTLISNRLHSEDLWNAPRATILGWVLAFGMKIYLDFSGYSDIAIGSSYLFGIEVPENFNWPYLSRNIREFWQRWHISLSRWIFDYIYAPLGGSRHGKMRTIACLLTAFMISGLWHGAATHFLLWGLWHGVLSVIYRVWESFSEKFRFQLPKSIAVALTFVAVNLGWVLFCLDVKRATFCLGRVMGW